MAKNQEFIKDGDTEYCFAGNFDMLESLEGKGHDLADIFNTISSGSLPLTAITDTLAASLHTIDNEEPAELSKIDTVKTIIEKYGLQEAAMIARMMLSYAMVGSVKKHQMDRDEMIQGMMSQIIGSQSMSLKKRGFVWMALSVYSVFLACLTFSVLSQHFC